MIFVAIFYVLYKSPHIILDFPNFFFFSLLTIFNEKYKDNYFLFNYHLFYF